MDAAIVDALAARRRLVREVLAVKDGRGLDLRDPAREAAILARLADRASASGLDRHLIERVYREVFADSRRIQAELLLERELGRGAGARVAYSGTPGSWSEEAARQCFALVEEATLFDGVTGFADVVEAVLADRADFGVLPIENSTAGAIDEVQDLLVEHDLPIVDEVVVRVEHCLLALPGVGRGDIRRVRSHPQALAQCRRYLRALGGAAPLPALDTAAAAREVSERGDRAEAAIASARAGALHGLVVLDRGIADRPVNLTRFVVLARQSRPVDLRIPCRTSLTFSTRHERGALARALAVLADHGLNLTRLASRPRPGVAWEVRFDLDFEGNARAPEVERALAALAREVSDLKMLGSYPRADLRDGPGL